MNKEELDFLEWKHNVLNRIARLSTDSVTPFATYSTTVIPMPKKRYPSRKGYGTRK